MAFRRRDFHPACGSIARKPSPSIRYFTLVIWITGLSGSGKSTLSSELYRRLKASHPTLVRLDGDDIRAAFGADLSYREPDRARQIARIQRIAKLLADQGIDVIVGALYAHPDLLAWNRANLPDYFEIYLKAEIEFLRGRDPKGLYARAIRGEMTDVVGLDIPWHAPANPDLVVDAAVAPPVEAMARHVIDAIAGRRGPAAQRIARA